MALAGIITSVTLLLYFWAAFNVQRARKRHNVPAPGTHSVPEFNRVIRTQQTLNEHLIIFIPSLWLFSYFLSEFWGCILGSIWIVGRLVYAIGYYQSPEKRHAGNLIALPAELLLILGALIGATAQLSVVGIG